MYYTKTTRKFSFSHIQRHNFIFYPYACAGENLFSSTINLIQSFDNMSYVTGDLQVIFNIFLRQYSYRVPYTITLILHQTEALSLYILFSHNQVIIFWASTCVLYTILANCMQGLRNVCFLRCHCRDCK